MRKRVIGLGLVVAAVLCLAVVAGSGATTVAAAPERADSILILKKDHVLELLTGGKVIRSYKVALGSGGLAAKERAGDGRMPEGHYVIDSRNEHSAYHRALHISYPNDEDRRRAAKLGVSREGRS
jgi:murein L,D-transpeptidase YafK